MSPSRRRWISLGFLGLAVGTGGMWWVQRREAEALRIEVMLLRDAQRDLDARREEHRRLLAAQAPAAEVERLRADRAVLLRLRGEIEALQASAERKARRQAAPAGDPP